jgi:putative effector of murein hydrolase LrgA (UPF0299 family)
MPVALTLLLGFTLLGGMLASALHLPLPGPVVGMFALALALGWRLHWRRRVGREATPVPAALGRLADGLIGLMGLMFIPAGVGVIAELGVLRQQWLPIVVALLGSTVLSLLTTALVMRALLRRHPAEPALDPANLDGESP